HLRTYFRYSGASVAGVFMTCLQSLFTADDVCLRYASYRPPSSAAWGRPTCPASCRIGGTEGSETKLCQPSASQSKSTQTRSSSLGSRNTVEPLEPCCLRFSAPLVENTS